MLRVGEKEGASRHGACLRAGMGEAGVQCVPRGRDAGKRGLGKEARRGKGGLEAWSLPRGEAREGGALRHKTCLRAGQGGAFKARSVP